MIPVDEADAGGGQVTVPGQLQFGPMLLGSGTAARWRTLVGWRDLPEAQTGDSPRPQAHGDYPGSVFGGALLVTFTFLLRGTPAEKQTDLATLERWTQLSAVEQWLAVDDGDGVWMRRARVIARSIPQDKHFTHAPLECSVQFLCADPRRYAYDETTGQAVLASGSGGLVYPLVYPLTYGTQSTGALVVNNTGSTDAPLVAVFSGPLTDPQIVCGDWTLAFDIDLAAGESLVVDTGAGTALLNGTADRIATITALSDPLDVCVFPPGSSTLTLTAVSGSGSVQITYRDTRM